MAILATGSVVFCIAGFWASPSGAPLANVTISHTEPTTSPLFQAGRATTFNIYVGNSGPELGEGGTWWAIMFIAPSTMPLTDQSNIFEKVKLAARSTTKVEFPLNRSPWTTLSTNILSTRDVQDLKDGRVLLYIMADILWGDSHGKHEREFCQTLQPPQHLGEDDFIPNIWHECGIGHNSLVR
jgi:hypothetical protein